MMKNDALYFTLKALFVFKIFNFFSCLFGPQKTPAWWEKDKVNFKIYDVTIWEQTIAIHILPSISRIKGNQTMKFGQLIEYNMRNISLEKSYTKCDEKLFPDPFLQNQNRAYLWINILKFYTVCFIFMSSWRLSKYIETKLQTTSFYLIQSFLKNKKRLEIVPPNSFSAWFLKKKISLVVFY